MKHMVIPSAANCATFYTLSKIHKPTLAFRPIIFSISTAKFYKLDHFLLQSVAHLICYNPCTVKHSYDFVEKFKHISLSNYILL